MSRLVGVIPAAGRGTRAYPYSRGLPKCMLEIDGEPILSRTLAIFRDQLRIRDVVVVVGENGDIIRRNFGDGASHGVRITYVQNNAVHLGLSHSVLLAQPHVDEHFCVILSDECYLGSNHAAILSLPYGDALAVCGVARTDEPERVSKNYAVEVRDGLVRRLVEKPGPREDALLGLGTFLFHRKFFAHLERALSGREPDPTDLVSVLGRACEAGERVLSFEIAGRYVNVNDRDELNAANNLVRAHNFERRSMALAVIHRDSAERSLKVVEEFRALGRFRDIVLVLPPGTEWPPASSGGVRIVRAATDSYGSMMRAGLDACEGDILFTVYGDGSFSPRDVSKFAEYLKEADMVVGTRTTRQLIHQGSNMRGIVRLAHVSLAKFLELVWWTYEPRFTDVGCTYRALWSSTYRLIRPCLEATGPEYSVEMFLETLRCRRRIIEIPVNFQLSRKGLKERDQTLRTFLAMMVLIVKRRISGRGPRHASPGSRAAR